MAGKYALKARAERQAETRRRIVDAAIELHTKQGPARTTVSAVAARAGVQRHTYYRHFPDLRALLRACSAAHLERDPFPDPAPWRELADPVERLRRGLTELYAYYARNAELLANLERDVAVCETTREVVDQRLGPVRSAIREALAEGLVEGRAEAAAALDLALAFRTWDSLVRRSGLSQADAVEVMVRAVGCVAAAR